MPTVNIQTLIIKPGECVYVPKDANLLSMLNTGGLNITSDCLDMNIPAPICAQFVFNLDDVDNDNFDATDGATIASVFIKGVQYPINFQLMNAAGTGGTFSGINIMNVAGITSSVLSSTTTASQRAYTLAIQMPAAYLNNIEIKLTFSTGRWPNGLYIKPLIVTC